MKSKGMKSCSCLALLQRSNAGRFALVLFIAVLPTLVAQVPPPGPDDGAFPEPVSAPSHQPKAVYTNKAMVAAAHPLAAKAGVEIMKAGGTAMDAAVAVQMVLNVVEPQSSGIGGGCFILYWDAAKKQVYCLDGREEAPSHARREHFLDDDGKVRHDAMVGPLSSGIPGTVAAMETAHKRHGILPWKELFQPAIKVAREGFGISPRLQAAIASNRERLLLFPSSKALFLNEVGQVPDLGTVVRNPDLAKTLEIIAEKGAPGFYQGELAERLATAVGAEELGNRGFRYEIPGYRPIEREPVRLKYKGFDIVGMPPPSSGTLTLGLMLHLLEPIPPAERKPGTLDEIEIWARAESVAFADRNAYIGDPDFSPTIRMNNLLKIERLGHRWAAFAKLKPGTKALPGPHPAESLPTPPPPSREPKEGVDTTHFSIVDPDGNVLAVTTTIEHGMGCGMVVPGCGYLLNNELTDFDLDTRGPPNQFEYRRVTLKDEVRKWWRYAGKRPRSSMTPLLVFKDGKPVMTLGSPGGSRIIGVVGQTLVGVIDHDLDLQAAINLPRMSCRNRGKIELEGHYPDRSAKVAALEKMGWPVQPLTPGYEAWGGAQGIRILPSGKLEGAADPRREGAVRGW